MPEREASRAHRNVRRDGARKQKRQPRLPPGTPLSERYHGRGMNRNQNRAEEIGGRRVRVVLFLKRVIILNRLNWLPRSPLRGNCLSSERKAALLSIWRGGECEVAMAALKDLLKDLEVSVVQGVVPDQEISAVVYDSRKVTKGCLFVCIEGANFDGHTAAAQAASQGAAALVVCKEVKVPEGADVCILRVADTRYALASLSAAWFGHPAQKLKTIGITGTKGKTTSTYLVKSILENAGLKVGLIGTIETIIGDTHIHAENTTPESWLLQSYLARMVEEGCDAVVMEVSSQALKLHRSQGFVFDFGIFTNMEPDHIGPNEHDSFEEYMQCKGLLFRQCRVGIVNRDDSHWETVLSGHTCTLETYGCDGPADLRAADLRLVNENGRLGVAFRVEGLMEMEAQIAMPGRFSVYNALTAIAICRHFGVSCEDIRRALAGAKVRGRIEPVKVSDEFTLLIDYAHNAMALESLLTTLKEYEHGRLVCVFGCGGNRSKLRRLEMGEVSGRLADLTVITSDNPRFEEPQAIIDDIITGIRKTDGKYVEICDRKEAIAWAIEHAQAGDIIVLAGKGHEDYQEICGVKHPMDERVLIAEIMEEGNAGQVCKCDRGYLP